MNKKIKYVSPLTREEKELVPQMVKLIRTRSKLGLPIKNRTLVSTFRDQMLPGDKRRRIQVIIHDIRVTGKVKNLLASGDGYYISRKESNKKAYKAALRSRIKSLKEVYQSLG